MGLNNKIILATALVALLPTGASAGRLKQDNGSFIIQKSNDNLDIWLELLQLLPKPTNESLIKVYREKHKDNTTEDKILIEQIEHARATLQKDILLSHLNEVDRYLASNPTSGGEFFIQNVVKKVSKMQSFLTDDQKIHFSTINACVEFSNKVKSGKKIAKEDFDKVKKLKTLTKYQNEFLEKVSLQQRQLWLFEDEEKEAAEDFSKYAPKKIEQILSKIDKTSKDFDLFIGKMTTFLIGDGEVNYYREIIAKLGIDKLSHQEKENKTAFDNLRSLAKIFAEEKFKIDPIQISITSFDSENNSVSRQHDNEQSNSSNQSHNVVDELEACAMVAMALLEGAKAEYIENGFDGKMEDINRLFIDLFYGKYQFQKDKPAKLLMANLAKKLKELRAKIGKFKTTVLKAYFRTSATGKISYYINDSDLRSEDHAMLLHDSDSDKSIIYNLQNTEDALEKFSSGKLDKINLQSNARPTDLGGVRREILRLSTGAMLKDTFFRGSLPHSLSSVLDDKMIVRLLSSRLMAKKGSINLVGAKLEILTYEDFKKNLHKFIVDLATNEEKQLYKGKFVEHHIDKTRNDKDTSKFIENYVSKWKDKSIANLNDVFSVKENQDKALDLLNICFGALKNGKKIDIEKCLSEFQSNLVERECYNLKEEMMEDLCNPEKIGIDGKKLSELKFAEIVSEIVKLNLITELESQSFYKSYIEKTCDEFLKKNDKFKEAFRKEYAGRYRQAFKAFGTELLIGISPMTPISLPLKKIFFAMLLDKMPKSNNENLWEWVGLLNDYDRQSAKSFKRILGNKQVPNIKDLQDMLVTASGIDEEDLSEDDKQYLEWVNNINKDNWQSQLISYIKTRILKLPEDTVDIIKEGFIGPENKRPSKLSNNQGEVKTELAILFEMIRSSGVDTKVKFSKLFKSFGKHELFKYNAYEFIMWLNPDDCVEDLFKGTIDGKELIENIVGDYSGLRNKEDIETAKIYVEAVKDYIKDNIDNSGNDVKKQQRLSHFVEALTGSNAYDRRKLTITFLNELSGSSKDPGFHTCFSSVDIFLKMVFGNTEIKNMTKTLKEEGKDAFKKYVKQEVESNFKALAFNGV